MEIPIQHISVRVPWHDTAWNGKVCKSPRENGSCVFLPRISAGKNPSGEEKIAGSWLHELDESLLPPCISEKASFMSPYAVYKSTHHPYSKNPKNSRFYGHYDVTKLCYPGYSFSVVPYNWMSKNSKDESSDKAIRYGLDYKPEREPNLNFKNSWVQQIDNQRALLDMFIKPIVEHKSLVFIYAKNVPYVENTSRVLIGVGYVEKIGGLTEYKYKEGLPTDFKSTLWERPIHHTIREGFTNGFLMPYHDLFAKSAGKDDFNPADYIAYAPSFEEFSYGSEWVGNDSAIECLLLMKEKLIKLADFLEKEFSVELGWIDTELARLWKLRGPFPGLSSVLQGLRIENAERMAWWLDFETRDKKTLEVIKSPWDILEHLLSDQDQSRISTENTKWPISTTIRQTWKAYQKEQKDLIIFLSRISLSAGQARAVIDLKVVEQKKILENPYLLYEDYRFEQLPFDISLIDKAMFTKENDDFPLPVSIVKPDALDPRRIRAYAVKILESAAENGNTLLTDTQLVTAINQLPLDPVCDPSIHNLIAIRENLEAEVLIKNLDEEKELFYFKLVRLEAVRSKIAGFVTKRTKRPIKLHEEPVWKLLIDKEIDPIAVSEPQWYRDEDAFAREEKAAALQILANSRISVLLGPAGTGKTKLLNIFCKLPFIASGSILKLAPTGKARVNMGKDAKTIAQFLVRTKRYEPNTGRYHLNPDGANDDYNTVIIDESSMLTEEQLGALLEALTGVERLILVGDDRQLPPIGPGRPFADILTFLRDERKGVAELTTLFRQSERGLVSENKPQRMDVRLSKWFGNTDFKKYDEDIFKEISGQKGESWPNIRFVEWQSVKELEDMLIDVVDQEIGALLQRQGIKGQSDRQSFDLSLGARKMYDDSDWLGFEIASAKKVENWQIINPMRTTGHGTKAINQMIQGQYRGDTKALAITPSKWGRKSNKPVGDDKIVYGDKVINMRNKRLDYQPFFTEDGVSGDDVLKYIANGEIGIHTGVYGKWTKEDPRPVCIAFSSQPGYSYRFEERDFEEESDLKLELAYSITVHKSQGSGFGTVLLILPNPCILLSRELFYTALTRQEERIVILHQGSFHDFRKYTMGEYSETARRLTDLFSAPQLKEVDKKVYDSKYVQISEKGEFMISKSEVIIADKLHHNKIKYIYELPVKGSTGITIHPDFTIEDPETGIVYYWEHLGMLPDDKYRSKWHLKTEWYEREGIREYTEDNDADRQLIITRDSADGGIDSQQIKEIIDKLF